MQQTFLGGVRLAQYLVSVVASGLKELLFLLPVPYQGVPVLRLIVQLACAFFAHRFTTKSRVVLFVRSSMIACGSKLPKATASQLLVKREMHPSHIYITVKCFPCYAPL